MSKKYSFTETKIAYESFLYYSLEGASLPEHREIIRQNSDKLRIVDYTHQFPDGSESICYHIQGYVPLDKVFGKRRINFEELALLLYGIVHTVFNAKKCGLNPDAFALDPSHIYLSHNSIQPYLIYLPTKPTMSLREEFLALLSFLDEVSDAAIPNTKKLVSALKSITEDNFDMATIINAVVQAANTNEVTAPVQPATEQVPPREKAPDQPEEPAKPLQPSAPVPDHRSAPVTPTVLSPAKKSAPAAPMTVFPAIQTKKEAPKGLLARLLGWITKSKEPEDFLPDIDDRTMLHFTVYADGKGQPILYVMEGSSRTEQIPVTNNAFVLGRNPKEADHCFATDKGISRIHAVIIYDGNGYFVTDKGSSGGTFVNGIRIAPGESVPIQSGDVINLHKKKLLFEVE